MRTNKSVCFVGGGGFRVSVTAVLRENGWKKLQISEAGIPFEGALRISRYSGGETT